MTGHEQRSLEKWWSVAVALSVMAVLTLAARRGTLPYADTVIGAVHLLANRRFAQLLYAASFVSVLAAVARTYRAPAVARLALAVRARGLLTMPAGRYRSTAWRIATVAVVIAAVIALVASVSQALAFLVALTTIGATVALLVGAGWVLGTPATGARLAGAQAFALLALALLVWTRPQTRALPEVDAALAATISLGVIGFYAARMRASTPTPDNHLRVVTVVWMAVAMALPIAARNVAAYWNMSGWMDSHSYDVAAINIATGKVPWGQSFYMPVYQYGMALIYWSAGHFFFVQQLINIAALLIAVAATVGAAWLLFARRAAAAVAGVAMIASVEIYQYTQTTQIENWYVAMLCLAMLAWARYWRAPRSGALIVLALALAVGINTRNQGAVFFGVMCLAPLWVPPLTPKTRLLHTALCISIVALSLLPWAYRNYVIEGRFSPAASRSSLYMGVLNDRRIGLYGLRYWEGWSEVERDYEIRYPSPVERERALLSAAWRLVADDPAWTARAWTYRALAFYGLLPSGLLSVEAIYPTDWAREWRTYLYWRLTPIVLISLSLLALVLRFNRVQAFLTLAVLANLSIVMVAASPESRVSLPSLPLHALMAAGLFAKGDNRNERGLAPERARFPVWLPVTIAMVAVVVLRATVGASNVYAPIIERRVTVNHDVNPGTGAPLGAVTGEGRASAAMVGRYVSLRCMLSNYMYPPRIGGAAPGMPSFAGDPNREQYFYAYLLSPDHAKVSGVVAVAFAGAEVSEPLREGMLAQVEGVLMASEPVPAGQFFAEHWVRATRVTVLPTDPAQLPAYR